MVKFTKYKWRFYSDNNIEQSIVEFLRKSNLDVLWITEIPNLRKQQEDIFHYLKARKLRRYLLTRDLDFWNDQRFPLKNSPGVVIITTEDTSIVNYLPMLLRKLINDYNTLPEPLYLDGVKLKLGLESIVIKMVDRDTQRVTTESWNWKDLF